MDTAQWNREWVMVDGAEEITEEERIAGKEDSGQAIAAEFDREASQRSHRTEDVAVPDGQPF